jgi:hypothetical protein
MPYYYTQEQNDEEFGNHKPSHTTRRRATPKPKPKPKAKLKMIKTKKPHSLKPDKGLLSRTVLQGYGRGGTVGDGVGISYDPLSIYNPPPPPPPPLRIVSTTTKQPGKLDSLFGIASQVIAGWSQNKTIQTADGQIPLYEPQQYQQQPQQYQQQPPNNGANPNGDNSGGAGEGAAKELGKGFDGIINWASQNPLIVLGVAGGAYLLFKQPPKYGNR